MFNMFKDIPRVQSGYRITARRKGFKFMQFWNNSCMSVLQTRISNMSYAVRCRSQRRYVQRQWRTGYEIKFIIDIGKPLIK